MHAAAIRRNEVCTPLGPVLVTDVALLESPSPLLALVARSSAEHSRMYHIHRSSGNALPWDGPSSIIDLRHSIRHVSVCGCKFALLNIHFYFYTLLLLPLCDNTYILV